MNTSLAEVLQQLNLEAGTYHFHLKTHDIEIRIMERKPPEAITAASYNESDVMLEPWVELPTPEPLGTVMAYPAPPPPPDIPEIPSEDDLL